MADILLTHSNHLYNDRKQVRKMQPYPPLQTLMAAACLRRARVFGRALRFHLRGSGERVSRALSPRIARAWSLSARTISTSSPRCACCANRELAFWMARRRGARGSAVRS